MKFVDVKNNEDLAKKLVEVADNIVYSLDCGDKVDAALKFVQVREGKRELVSSFVQILLMHRNGNK